MRMSHVNYVSPNWFADVRRQGDMTGLYGQVEGDGKVEDDKDDLVDGSVMGKDDHAETEETVRKAAVMK